MPVHLFEMKSQEELGWNREMFPHSLRLLNLWLCVCFPLQGRAELSTQPRIHSSCCGPGRKGNCSSRILLLSSVTCSIT